MWSIGKAPPNGIALKLRAQRPGAQGGGAADKRAGQRGNAILPTRAPGSFKRLLGRRRTYAPLVGRFVIASAAESARSITAPTARRTAWNTLKSSGRECSGAGFARGDGRGGRGGVSAPTAVGGRRPGGTSSPCSCVCRSTSFS